MYAVTGRFFARLAFPLLAAVLFFLAGCSGDDAPTGPSDNWNNNSVKFEVEWKSGVVRFDSTDMNDLISIDTAQQVFTFRSSNSKVGTIQAGSIVVVNDYTIRRATAVSESGGNTVVRTSAAALTDAMQNADIQWDYGVDYKPEQFVKSLRKKGIQVQQITTDSIKFSLKIGSYTYKIDMRLNDDKANFTLVAEKEASDIKVAECSLVGEMRRFRNKGKVLIQNGQLQEFSTNNTGVEGDFTVKVVAAGSGNDLSIEVPITLLKYPIPQLPFFDFTVKTLIVMNAVVPPDGSTLLEANFKYNTDQGIEFDRKNSVVLPILNVKKREFDKTRQPQTGASTPIAVSWGLALPRLELGLLGTTIGWVQTAYLVGGDYTPHFPPCQQAKARFIGACGWALGALGVSVLEGSKTMWDQEKILLKAGNCP